MLARRSDARMQDLPGHQRFDGRARQLASSLLCGAALLVWGAAPPLVGPAAGSLIWSWGG